LVAFFTDECCSGRIVAAVRAAGFDVVRAVDICPSADDRVVLALAYAQRRILLTEDYDFGDLCIRFGLPTHGVVIVAVKSLPLANQGTRVAKCLIDLGDKVLGSFVTIEPTRVRLRALPHSTSP
jgi:predicted nuclease of predicted toxin-antitoxin system